MKWWAAESEIQTRWRRINKTSDWIKISVSVQDPAKCSAFLLESLQGQTAASSQFTGAADPGADGKAGGRGREGGREAAGFTSHLFFIEINLQPRLQLAFLAVEVFLRQQQRDEAVGGVRRSCCLLSVSFSVRRCVPRPSGEETWFIVRAQRRTTSKPASLNWSECSCRTNRRKWRLGPTENAILPWTE